MPIFKIHTSYDGRGIYTVEAKDETEAEEKYSDEYISYKEDVYDPEHDSNEEVIGIELVK